LPVGYLQVKAKGHIHAIGVLLNSGDAVTKNVSSWR
jgi:hypothetical protein